MNNYWALFYGFIQGVTEFLPVSSSGHLALVPFFFELKDPGVVFDLMMHVGTALAVILYFRADIGVLIKQTFACVRGDFSENTSYVQNFILATVASFALIMLIKSLAFAYGRTPLLIAFNLSFFGLLMFLSDRSKITDLSLVNKKNFRGSVIIGLSQSLAVFPGVSRSGITLTASRFMGMSRLEASRFSFLLSLPVILGSVIFKLPEVLEGQATSVSMDIIFVGVIYSFVFGLLTIHFFLKLISKMGLVSFAVYRWILGLGLAYMAIQ